MIGLFHCIYLVVSYEILSRIKIVWFPVLLVTEWFSRPSGIVSVSCILHYQPQWWSSCRGVARAEADTVELLHCSNCHILSHDNENYNVLRDEE